MNIIVACDNNNIIGFKGTMPWNVPEDMAHFRKLTLGHIVIMGRKTFESIPGGKLQGRTNIVITNSVSVPNKYSKESDDIIFTNFIESFEIIKKLDNSKKIFIIGGSQIYELYFNYCNNIYLTKIYREQDDNLGDTFFSFDLQNFIEKEKSNICYSKNSNYKYQFIHYIRNNYTPYLTNDI